jgi:hypothetical protein
MKWWIMALIISVVWIGLCLGGAYFLFPSNTTPEQDSKLSEILGEVCGAGLVGIWAVIAWKFGKLGPKKPKV